MENPENPVFIKCEPSCSYYTEEDTEFEAKEEILPGNILDIKIEPDSLFPDVVIKEETLETKEGDILTKDEWTAVPSVESVTSAFPENATEVPGSEVDNSEAEKRNDNSESQESSVKTLGLEVGPWICNICGETSRTELLHKSHMSVHGNSREAENKSSSCSVCGKTFTTRSYLNIHMRLHTGKGFSCPECHKTYTRRGYLRTHMSVHTGQRSFICDVCGKSYARNCDLVNHKFSHTAEKPHVCSMCSKSFVMRSTLEKHMLIHCEDLSVEVHESLYECSACNKSFTQSSEFYLHSLSHLKAGRYCFKDSGLGYLKLWDVNNRIFVLTGVKVHSCTLCSKTFSRMYDFKRHMLSHLGNRPAFCSICGKAFLQKSNLVAHMATHGPNIEMPP